MKDEAEGTSLSVPERPAPDNLLQVIAQAVADPRMDVEKMERLFALQERINAQQREIDFDDAMNRLQAKLPQIPKYGQGKNSKYAKYEDLDVIIRPLLAEEGFSLTFSEAERTAKETRFELKVSRAGHSKVHRLTVQQDTAATNREGRSVRPPIQDDGSTASYARRYLTKLALNIVEKDEDTDGENRRPITEEQAKDIEAAIQELKMDRGKFLVFMGCGDVGEILAKDLKKAINAIDTRRRNPK